jgi:tetratricopeptide (TPR) repeat protein
MVEADLSASAGRERPDASRVVCAVRVADRATADLAEARRRAGRPFIVLVTAATAVAIAASIPRVTAQSPGLTGGEQVARTYDTILDARFEEVTPLLTGTCPPAPAEVCQLLAVVSMWWQIQQDPLQRGLDPTFQQQADAAIDQMERWTMREPGRAEAWFYLGGAVGARAQWRVLRGQTVAAARDGKRIKSSLERALMLDPGLLDAYFGIGLYHYYAGVAPAFAKILRWLLLLPGGDRERGLDEMLRARNGGQLLRSEADYQLYQIYRWYEKQPSRAIELLTALAARYPHNPHFSQQIAEIEDHTENHAGSLRVWEELRERARSGRVANAPAVLARAELGTALELDHLGRPEAALPHLRAVIDAKPRSPVGAEALAQLQLGNAYDRLARREQAIAAYRAALAMNPAGDPLKIESRARTGLRTPAR